MMHHAAAALLTWAMTTASTSVGSEHTPVPPKAPSEIAYLQDITALATQSREPGSTGWQSAQDRIAGRLAKLGYEVERQTYANAKANGTAHGVNVIGTLRGRSKPDEIIVVAAHYDSNPGQQGADDNASGVAGMLAVAEALAQTQPERTLVVAAWDQEEYGLIGSNAWADRARKRKTRILHAYIYEMIGYRDTRPNTQRVPIGLDWLFPSVTDFLKRRNYAGDSIVLVGTDDGIMRDFVAAAEQADLPAMPLHIWWRLRHICPRDLRRSDHDAFWRNGFQATMITDTANFRNPHYHSVTDTLDTIDTAFACSVVQATIDTVHRQLNAP